jgi:hypothetical protein
MLVTYLSGQCVATCFCNACPPSAASAHRLPPRLQTQIRSLLDAALAWLAQRERASNRSADSRHSVCSEDTTGCRLEEDNLLWICLHRSGYTPFMVVCTGICSFELQMDTDCWPESIGQGCCKRQRGDRQQMFSIL